MIHIVKGDLLESDCTIIAHQANCFSVMNSGIAKQIRIKYPQAYEADVNYGPPGYKLGKYSLVFYTQSPFVIVNLYGQYQYGREDRVYTDYDALRNAMFHMFNMIKQNVEASLFNFPIKIGMPYGIGCGLANGDWSIVYNIIEETSSIFNLDVYLYKLEG